MSDKKKPDRDTATESPYLLTGRTRRPAKDYQDYDYLEKLAKKDPEALAWLNRFNREYLQNQFENSPNDLHPAKTKERRDCYARENARNRDMFTAFTRVPLFEDADLLDDDKQDPGKGDE